MKLLVRNIERSITEQELNQLFITFGKVVACSLVLDQVTGLSKGFGFVEMARESDGKAAMSGLNGKEIKGVKLRVKKAKAHYENFKAD